MAVSGFDAEYFQLFLDLILSQGSATIYWKKNNQTTTYWQKTLDELNAQYFPMFVDLNMFTGKRVGILK